MNLNNIKKEIENKLHIGFVLKNTDDGFSLTMADSDKDMFIISVDISSQARLFIETTIEEYGASFLKLINKSTPEKRERLVSFIKTNKKGEIGILINNISVLPIDFINNQESWNDFKLQFNEFPFINNEEEIVRIVTVLIIMMLSLLDYSIEGFEEGNEIEVISIKYERNPINREICLAHKGYRCIVCGFSFEEKYGEIGKGVIEVHHTIPVSEMGKGYVVNPIHDMEPVCSNCHTIIHKRKPPFSINEIKEIICKG